MDSTDIKLGESISVFGRITAKTSESFTVSYNTGFGEAEVCFAIPKTLNLFDNRREKKYDKENKNGAEMINVYKEIKEFEAEFLRPKNIRMSLQFGAIAPAILLYEGDRNARLIYVDELIETDEKCLHDTLFIAMLDIEKARKEQNL